MPPVLDYDKNSGTNFTRTEFMVVVNRIAANAVHDLMSEGDLKLESGKHKVKMICADVLGNTRMQPHEKKSLINRIDNCNKILEAVSDILNDY